MDSFCTHHLGQVKELEVVKGSDIRIAGMVSKVEHRFTKSETLWNITIEDYYDSMTFFLLEKIT